MGKKSVINHDQLPIVFEPNSRRMFLKSAMGLIAIPFIESLLPRRAWANTGSENAYKRAVFVVQSHGGHFLDALPQNVNFSEVASGVRAGSLQGATLGPIYNSDFQNLRSKLSVLTGLTLISGSGHNDASALACGYTGYQNTNKGINTTGVLSLFPASIDTVLAQHIYPNGFPEINKVLMFGRNSFAPHSYKTADGNRSYKALNGISLDAARSLFIKEIIVPNQGLTLQTAPVNRSLSSTEFSSPDVKNASRRHLLETALKSISMTKKSPKLSASAKARISDYQEMLNEVKNSIPVASPTPDSTTGPGTESAPTPGPGPAPSVSTPPIASGQCGLGSTSGDSKKAEAEIIVAALACGSTRLATMSLSSDHTMAHNCMGGARDSHLKYMRDTVLPPAAHLLKLMDQIKEANGNSLLENSAVLITSNLSTSAMGAHHGHAARVMVAGGLNGSLRMGECIDFSNRSVEFLSSGNQKRLSNSAGYSNGMDLVKFGHRPYNELLISIMRGFGLSQSHYSIGGQKGFGQYHMNEVHRPDLQKTKLFAKDIPLSTQEYFKKHFYDNGYNRDTALTYYLKK